MTGGGTLTGYAAANNEPRGWVTVWLEPIRHSAIVDYFDTAEEAQAEADLHDGGYTIDLAAIAATQEKIAHRRNSRSPDRLYDAEVLSGRKPLRGY